MDREENCCICLEGGCVMIYVDNAATTDLDEDAFGLMKEYLTINYGNASQLYDFYFTSSGTESDNWAIKMGSQDVDQIVISSIEHHAVLNSCKAVEASGKKAKYLSVNDKGEVCIEDLDELLGDRRSLVSVMYVNNEIGTIEPIKALAEITHRHGGNLSHRRGSSYWTHTSRCS